jgi:hypothetical protein
VPILAVPNWGYDVIYLKFLVSSEIWRVKIKQKLLTVGTGADIVGEKGIHHEESRKRLYSFSKDGMPASIFLYRCHIAAELQRQDKQKLPAV